MNKKAVSYEYVSFIIDLLAQRVGSNYDYIIGIGRGGLIPATMLAYKLNKKVLVFGINTYNNTVQTGHWDIYQPVTLPTVPSKFLVVDDICDTGNTFNIFNGMYSATDHTFDYASLFVKDKSSHMVNFYGFSVPEETWLTFPWEEL